jgi:hypothetical protein
MIAVGDADRPLWGAGSGLAGTGAIGTIRMKLRYRLQDEKRPRINRGLNVKKSTDAYFSEVLIEVNLAFRLLPRPLTTAIMASEMPAAIRPYSMAVAPDSFFTKRAIRFFIDNSM